MDEASKDEPSNPIDLWSDDRYFHLSSELQHFIREELENVEDRNKQDLSTAVSTINLWQRWHQRTEEKANISEKQGVTTIISVQLLEAIFGAQVAQYVDRRYNEARK
ncbi:hypothetical protein MPH_07493 [Macrophomina phaseolina MS6]|uniref:Uncharacterized protein n=1 Tax=Macrophomina phaseolina (strain MS6) TaxID=1126212 RepID=K2RYM5_MACPH|nr:hypothetical protein MPH_07493 [Macrophomina phaseolina MS6]